MPETVNPNLLIGDLNIIFLMFTAIGAIAGYNLAKIKYKIETYQVDFEVRFLEDNETKIKNERVFIAARDRKEARKTMNNFFEKHNINPIPESIRFKQVLKKLENFAIMRK